MLQNEQYSVLSVQVQVYRKTSSTEVVQNKPQTTQKTWETRKYKFIW
jgi:hypothetical protein